jgi:hypothetical protein
MGEPAKRVPKWLTIDVMVLVVGAVIIIAAALWLEPTRDDIVQRAAQSASQQASRLWQYVTEKKPVVPNLKGPTLGRWTEAPRLGSPPVRAACRPKTQMKNPPLGRRA